VLVITMLSSNHNSQRGSKTQSQHSRRNRKTHIYVSTNNNEEEQLTAQFGAEKPSSHHHMNMNTMTAAHYAEAETQYKWTRCAATIQSAFEVLAQLVLTVVVFLWNWTSNTVLHYLRTSEFNLFKSVWNYILATMTIEIVTTVSTENGSSPNSDADPTTTITTLTSCVPVLRLNSVTMDEAEQVHHLSKGLDSVLLEDDEDKLDAGIDCGSDFVQSNSSNYNSSDGEQDTIVFTDDENSNSDNSRALTTSLASTLELLEKQSQQQLYASRRDSDSSCDGSADISEIKKDANADTGDSAAASSEDVETRIINQVESMFSDDHLAKDGFLLKHVRRRTDGFVSLKLVAGLRKVKQISKDFNVVVEALRKASKVEVNSDGTKVRRIDPLTPTLKSLPIASSNKDKDKNANENGQKPRSQQGRNSLEQQQLSDSELAKCMRAHVQLYNSNSNYQRRSQRFSNASMTSGSSVSPASSANSSRNGSFSYQHHPGGDLFNRNQYYGSGLDLDGLEQVLLRRRGGSLPISAHSQQKRHSHSSATGNQLYLSPSSSPPTNAAFGPGQHRPKSNSYCEGANINGSNSVGMSAWLQKRLASSRTSEGNISLSATVIRQPRGPDGTKGFAAGYRNMILEERQVRERKIGQQMI